MKEVKHPLTYEELLQVLGRADLKILTDYVFCSGCTNPKIVDYEENIFVNDLFDVILEGKCSECGKAVGRYLETGEDDENVEKLRKFLFEK